VPSTETALPDLADLDRPALERLFEAAGLPRFRARQVFRSIYRKGETDVARMSNLGAAAQAEIARRFRITTPVLEHQDRSADGTRKFLLRLADGRRIEAVYIPDTPKQTFCISSQVGCAMDCDFCLTGKMGFTRHLTPAEIVGQVRVLAHETGLRDTPFNIVLMGMGEPLHNYDAVMTSMRILADEEGLAMPPRRVTLSTVGVVPAMEKLAREPIMPNLAVSLHATTDEQRNRLVPINRKYPLEALIDACRRFPVKRRNRITFEYVLLAGVNDTPEDARRLVRLLSDVKAKVNLLPLNAAPGIPYERPDEATVNRFARALAQHGLHVSVRKSRGRDIRAACGQLIVEGKKTAAGQRLAALMRN
jgi:23S rRNA (adenine2503-C2)-methyltransferase